MSYLITFCGGKSRNMDRDFGTIWSYRLNRNFSRFDRYFCKMVLRNEVDYIKYFRFKFKPSGSYQHILDMEGKEKPSTRKLFDRLRMDDENFVGFAASDSIAHALWWGCRDIHAGKHARSTCFTLSATCSDLSAISCSNVVLNEQVLNSVVNMHEKQ